jgi:hypothetical protein
MRQPWFASDVWLPERWARNVRCEVDGPTGRIVRIVADANADGCETATDLSPPETPPICATMDASHSSLIGRDRDSWLDAYVFCAAGNPVRDVMVGGRWVIRDGRHALEEGIAARYAGALRELKS